MTASLQEAEALLDKWVIYDDPAINYKPHPGQLAILESSARHQVAACGRRFGKSDVGGHKLLPEAFLTFYLQDELKERGHRREFWIVGPEYSDAEKEFRVIWNLLEKLQMPLDNKAPFKSHFDPIGGSMHISLWKGRFQIHAKSAKYPDTLVGEALSGVILAEAAKQKPSIWPKYIRPTLADFNGWSFHPSTPEGKNHFYDKWQMGQDPANKQWQSWRMPSWINPYVYKGKTKNHHVKALHELRRRNPGVSIFTLIEEYKLEIDPEIADLMNDLTQEAFNQEIAASFTEYVGQVFKDFDEEYHVGDLKFNTDPRWETYAAVDYGFTNPSVWLLIQVGPMGEINVLDEVYEEGLTAEDFAMEIRRRGLNPPSLRIFYPDPASPGDSKILEAKLQIRAATGTGGELKDRIDLIRKALKTSRVNPESQMLGIHTDFRPQLMFDRKCVRTLADMDAYRYPDTKDKNETSLARYDLPMKKDDHGPEALGRFMIGYFRKKHLIEYANGRAPADPGALKMSRMTASARRAAVRAGRYGGYPAEREKDLAAMRPVMGEKQYYGYKKPEEDLLFDPDEQS